MTADQDGVLKREAATEFQWAISRPSSLSHGKDDLDHHDPLAFKLALAASETEHLEAYRASTPGHVFQLNQNPSAGFGSTSTPWALATLIRNCGLLYFDDLERWMLPTEILSTQGFPVVPKIFNLASEDSPKLCSFNHYRKDRTGRQIGAQAGNSMHVFPMTVLQLHSLVCLRHQVVPEPLVLISRTFYFDFVGPGGFGLLSLSFSNLER